ncbi:MAG: hypothetical protein LPK19_01690, partial [Hymenobacteraceae bacterium]|nr:hypothetical protein [Hymenobacteraceae bacterium]MDX5394887.1 hypothetical protein [Hymenobacteraceae bacterium]MDX5510921.1 hypothetical protein [Hymenobacteraceae bacterium]
MLFVTFLLLIPRAGFQYDVDFWSRWAVHIFEKGLSNVYQVGDNTYNPIFHYILFLYTKLTGSVEKIQHYIHFLKGFTLVFDFIGAIVAASLVKDKHQRFVLTLFLLFNIGFLYNTLVWEQIDGIFSCLAFVAVVCAIRNRPVWSIIFYTLSIYTKTQAIIFLPPLLLLWFPFWAKSFKTFSFAIVATAILQVLILAPFMWVGDENYLGRIIDNNIISVDTFPIVSLNAYNFWFLVLDARPLHEVSDAILFNGLSYKTWGLLLFFVSSVAALLPIAFLSLSHTITKQEYSSKNYAA